MLAKKRPCLNQGLFLKNNYNYLDLTVTDRLF